MERNKTKLWRFKSLFSSAAADDFGFCSTKSDRRDKKEASIHFPPFPSVVSVKAKEVLSWAAAPHRFGMQAVIHIHRPTPPADASRWRVRRT